MPSSGPVKPLRPDGSTVDATFELTTVSVFEIVYHHKAGGRDSPRAVNSDYHEGLELLLERLARVGASVLGISVDSTVAHELDEADRELDLPFPIDLDTSLDIAELRKDITRAQKPIARRPDAKPGGGNDQKRIRMTVTCATDITYDSMREVLIFEPQVPSTGTVADIASCPHCGTRNRAPAGARNLRCGRCHERFQPGSTER